MNSIQRARHGHHRHLARQHAQRRGAGPQVVRQARMNELVNDVVPAARPRPSMLQGGQGTCAPMAISRPTGERHARPGDRQPGLRALHALRERDDRRAGPWPGHQRHHPRWAASAPKIGDLMGTVVVPFLPLEPDADYEALVDLANASSISSPRTRSSTTHWRMIERIGLVNFLEASRSTSIRTWCRRRARTPTCAPDGWDDEVARIQAKGCAWSTHRLGENTMAHAPRSDPAAPTTSPSCTRRC